LNHLILVLAPRGRENSTLHFKRNWAYMTNNNEPVTVVLA
jgi:hypothetical protein